MTNFLYEIFFLFLWLLTNIIQLFLMLTLPKNIINQLDEIKNIRQSCQENNKKVNELHDKLNVENENELDEKDFESLHSLYKSMMNSTSTENK
jgi:hypothetical protein